MNRDKLISMSNDQVRETFLNKAVHVILNDDQEVDFIVANLQSTIYSPDMSYSVVGFISKTGKSYSFLGIKEVTVIDK